MGHTGFIDNLADDLSAGHEQGYAQSAHRLIPGLWANYPQAYQHEIHRFIHRLKK
jgi:hypothetical protein